MVGSFFATPHLRKIRFDSNLGCGDTTNQLRRPGQYLASRPVFGGKWANGTGIRAQMGPDLR